MLVDYPEVDEQFSDLAFFHESPPPAPAPNGPMPLEKFRNLGSSIGIREGALKVQPWPQRAGFRNEIAARESAGGSSWGETRSRG